MGGASCGIQTAALCMGGEQDPGAVANTEQWDGSAWTEVADISVLRSQTAGGGTTAAAFITAGSGPGSVTATEEWATPQTVKIITD